MSMGFIVSLQRYEKVDNIYANVYLCTLCIKNMTGLTAADNSANASNIRKINQITLRARPHLDDLAGGDGRRFLRLDALSAHF